jgi:polysaccharide biosynthesis protein PslF
MANASVALVGTYPPTECGLATFTRSSATAISDLCRVGVVELVDEPRGNLASMVCGTWVRGDRRSLANAVAVINTFDAVIVQHEFGIFGGVDGEEVLQLVDELNVPIVVVLHTILQKPSAHQRFVIERLASRASALVTLTETARRRLIATADVDPERVVVIPHGAHEIPPSPHIAPSMNQRPVVLTWGLIGPGKGIEHAIDAIALLKDLSCAPEYWVVGETHPKVREVYGESYRDSLVSRARTAGIEHQVKFFDGYRDLQSLHNLVRQADLVVLPYDSREQVTSGVLVEAIAAGLPVVATDFPHARELLTGACGLVVPHEDPVALATAIRRVLTNAALRSSLVGSARQIAPTLYWPAVGRTFADLVNRCVVERNELNEPEGATA